MKICIFNLTMMILTFVPLLVFCGMLHWQFFLTALSESGNSLAGNANLISQVHFPRLIWPGFAVSGSVLAIVTACELAYFRKTERTFADVI